MKKSEKIILISILSLLTILVVFFVVMGFASCQTAYADYEDLNGSEILNFNQNVNNEYINFTVNDGQELPISFNKGILYIRINTTVRAIMHLKFSNSIYSINLNIGYNELIYDCGNDITSIAMPLYDTTSVITNFNIINLTTMFNEGNEPNLQQCKEIFKAPYYNYQKGSALTLNGIDAYQSGVDSVYNSMHYTLTASHIYNTAYAYEGEKLNETWTYNNQTVIATAITDGILAIPLGAVIDQGKTLRIYSGYIGFCLNSPNIDSGLGYLCWACRYNDSFIPIYIGGTAESAENDGYLQFTAPYAMDTLYLLESTTTGYITQPTNRSFGVFNTAVSVVELDASALVDNAFNQGYDSALKTFEAGGSNYLKIYNQGVRDAQTSGSVFQDAWAFVASAFEGVGSMLAVELIPNVPIGLFVAFPLLLGLIFFIVKLTKGGD